MSLPAITRYRVCLGLAAGVWILGAAPLSAQQPTDSVLVVLRGTVFDSLSGDPLPVAVVEVGGTSISTLTDDHGSYLLRVPVGDLELRVRRIGYRPVSMMVAVAEATRVPDVVLVPVPVELAPIAATTLPDPAREIVRRAIERRHDVLGSVHDYRYDAFVTFVVRDLGKPPDSAQSIALLSETRTTAYWERPGSYQETILARRQTSNLDPDRNLLSVHEIVNFNRNRVDLRRYSLVSPIADDALDHYRYHMLDTLVMDGRRVFRIAVEPGSESTPLFVGMVDIGDSTWEVRAIDVGVNRATRFNLVQNVRYRQLMRDLGDGRWVPVEIRLGGEVHLGIPLPGLPRNLAFEQVATLDHFRFDTGHPPPALAEYRIVVDDRADRPDSALWSGPDAPELTPAESAAWIRIDSIAAAPPGFGRRLQQGGLLVRQVLRSPDLFHFNRVDGAYLGVGHTFWPGPGTSLFVKLGSGTESERPQYAVEGRWRHSEPRRLWVGANWHDETVPRASWVSGGYNPTIRALLFRVDPLDYYRERGFALLGAARVVDFVGLDLRYDDDRQWSVPVLTEYSIFRARRAPRANPAISDGRLRAVKAGITYDSRSRLRHRHEERVLPSLGYTRIRAEAEVASPSLIPNDFDYRRYSLLVERRQRTFNFGITTLTAAGGIATGTVPSQRYFIVDFGMRALSFQGNGFNTLPEVNFAGTRAGMVVLRHDFDNLLFARSGLPLIRRLPFTLSLQGGVFWTDFANHIPLASDSFFVTAPKAYREIGFGLGNLTPFLRPINFAVHFTWQLSSYATRRFQFGIGLTRP